jgi:hypothetical protein
MAREGYEDLDVAASSVGFASIPDHNTSFAEFKVQTGDVRCRIDGNAAVAGNGGGQLLEVGETWNIQGADLISQARFIRNGSVSAVLDVIYA